MLKMAAAGGAERRTRWSCGRVNGWMGGWVDETEAVTVRSLQRDDVELVTATS